MCQPSSTTTTTTPPIDQYSVCQSTISSLPRLLLDDQGIRFHCYHAKVSIPFHWSMRTIRALSERESLICVFWCAWSVGRSVVWFERVDRFQFVPVASNCCTQRLSSNHGVLPFVRLASSRCCQCLAIHWCMYPCMHASNPDQPTNHLSHPRVLNMPVSGGL